MTNEIILVNEEDKKYYSNAYIISMAISNALNPSFKVWATFEGDALEILGEFLEQSYKSLISSYEEITEYDETEEKEGAIENYYGVNGGEYYINVPLYSMWIEASQEVGGEEPLQPYSNTTIINHIKKYEECYRNKYIVEDYITCEHFDTVGFVTNNLAIAEEFVDDNEDLYIYYVDFEGNIHAPNF